MDGTDVSLKEQNWILLELSETSWAGYKVENNTYIASGDPKKLKLLILIFRMLIENGTVENSYIIEKMGED